MKIQWYPGHMHKAQKDMAEVLPTVDLVIEILDARIPYSSENPMIAALRKDKPCIKVLNKLDLADERLTAEWQAWLEREQGVRTLAVTKNSIEKIHQIPTLCKKMLPNRANQDRGIHAMIMGIPNVGKSTIINILAGRIIAKTGNEPAITKRQQRIKLDSGVVLHDTPGVLWPNVENENSGYRLATTGAIRETALEYEDVAYFAVDFMRKTWPERLIERYDLESLPETEEEILQLIGQQRGCLRSGGKVDFHKVSKLFLNELRAGMLGPFTLETPEEMQQELQEVETQRQLKAEKKSARLHKHRNNRS
jgi:ribosome biogenesis GTPase A